MNALSNRPKKLVPVPPKDQAHAQAKSAAPEIQSAARKSKPVRPHRMTVPVNKGTASRGAKVSLRDVSTGKRGTDESSDESVQLVRDSPAEDEGQEEEVEEENEQE